MEPGTDYKIARRRMVEEQLRPRGIVDERVLEAFLAVPRHEFVDPALGVRAYDDCSFPIGYEQTISQPFTIAFMVQALEVAPRSRVLEIGTGSGYQTAILSRLAHDVFSIERIEQLLDAAEAVLARLKTGSIRVKLGDGSLGWRSYAPFDRILVSAAMTGRPDALIEQLAEGGRLIAPISESAEHLVLFTKRDGRAAAQRIARCAFLPLRTGAA